MTKKSGQTLDSIDILVFHDLIQSGRKSKHPKIQNTHHVSPDCCSAGAPLCPAAAGTSSRADSDSRPSQRRPWLLG